MESTIYIHQEDVFHLVYDFLVRNLVLYEFVTESYKFHSSTYSLKNGKLFGKENTKRIISENIRRYCMENSSLPMLFISYEGSFQWYMSLKGKEFWCDVLDNKWKKYLIKKYKTLEIEITNI